MNFRPPKSLLTQLSVTGILALAFGWFVGMTTFYHIPSLERAYGNYIRNPTPENEAALKVEGGKLQHMRFVDSLKAALLFFFVINVVYSLFKRNARLAAVSLLAACSTVVAYVGLPSFPIDWRCCVTYYGPGVGHGVSGAAVQLTALGAWVATAALLALSLIYRHRASGRSAHREAVASSEKQTRPA